MSVTPPPAKLPSGKTNPAYTKWYRQTEAGKAALKKWNESDKGKECTERYKQTEKGALAYHVGQLKCIDCGCHFFAVDVIARGYKRVGKFNCICDDCNTD